MIGSLRGTLVERSLRSDHQVEVLVEAGGVGYRALVPAGSAGSACEVGAECFLWVHTHVREDALVLYGFGSRDERDCFELLLSAHGVGPALAAAVLSVLSPAALRRAVLAGDSDALALVPGIGKKTAQRLVLELTPRFEAAQVGLAPAGAAQAPAAAGRTGGLPAQAAPPQREEVRAALASLGYGPEEVRAVLARLGPDEPVEQMLRQALQELAAAR
jgi:Holliday junction DNA helicase RuvA